MSGAATPPSLLVLDCSPRAADSVSRRMGQVIEAALRERHPTLHVCRRDLGRAGALAAPAPLLQELAWAGQLLITSPVHNYTVPVGLKAWIDALARPGLGFEHTPEGKRGLLRDRPTWVAVAAGGAIFDDGARQPDFFRPYLSVLLQTLGIHDVCYLTVQRTAQRADPLAEAEQLTRAWTEAHLLKGEISCA